MIARGRFVAGAAAALVAAPRAAHAFIETTPSGDTGAADAKATLDAVAVIAAMNLSIRTVWRPPAAFPAIAPIAYYAGRDGGGSASKEPVVWLNPDHPELVSPRISRLTDEVPLFTELLLASVDARTRMPSLGLEKLAPAERRAAAAVIAAKVAVVAKYTPYVAVDDVEFARRAFAFAVLRQMTPGIGGVAPVPAPASAMPRDEPLVTYAGIGADPSVPRDWGVIKMALTDTASPRFLDAYTRAFVLATADRQPPESDVKRAYDAARARDDAGRDGDRWAARRAFAAPYAAQVAALFGR